MNFVSSITLMFKDAFSSGFAQAQNSFAGMQSALGDLNKNQAMNRLAADIAMATSLTDPFRQKLSAMLGEPSKLAGSFESSMKNIQAITGMASSEIDNLGGTLIKIGGAHAAGPLAVADAYGDVAGGITNVAAQLPVLEASLLLAEAGQADLGVATNGLVKILNSYNFSAGDAASVTEKAAWASDVMTQAVGMGVGSMQEFVSAMAPISGAAASVGVGFDEIGSTMAYMTATTDTAATAGTKLESFMTALQKPSDMLRNALKSIGIESGSAMLKQYGLAESAKIVSDLFGGSSDLITQALGRQEAKAAVISLMSDQYATFASEFGAAMQKTVTAEAAAIQNQAYESKLARLQAATDSLQIQIGGDINAIKGFFVDMGSGFLTNVVSPIMSSPVGEAFQGIAAVTGLAAKGVLDMGSGVLNTATQLVLLTATLQNSGGFMKLFKSSIDLMGAPLKGMSTLLTGMGKGILSVGSSIVGTLPKIGAWIASMWSVEAAHKAGAAIREIPSNILNFGKSIAQTIPKIGAWIVSMTRVAVVNTAVSGASLWSRISGGVMSLGRSFISALPAVVAWIASGWATAAAWLAATWPVLAVIAGVAALAVGAYFLIKNWDAVSAFFVNLWNKITGAFSAAFDWIQNLLGGISNKALGVLAIFLPFIGIPALIIKNWETIKAFFAGLWVRITTIAQAAFTWIKSALAGLGNFFTGIWTGIKNFFAGLWTGIASTFTSVWNGILSFFNSVWNGITQTVASVANWFSGVWSVVTGGFAGAWLWIKDLFTSVWENIKGVVMGFVEWLSPVIDMIIAPFKAIGNVIGGIVNAMGGWFGETVELGKTELAKAGENKTKAAAAKPVETADSLAMAKAAPAAANPITPPVTTTSAIAAPPIGGASLAGTTQTAQISAGANVSGGAGNSLLNEHLAAAARKGFAGTDISGTASGAFMGAGASDAFMNAGKQPVTGIDTGELEREVAVTFQAAMPAKTVTSEAPKQESERRNEKAGNKVFNIQNVNLNADDIQAALDIMRLIEMAVAGPSEALV